MLALVKDFARIPIRRCLAKMAKNIRKGIYTSPRISIERQGPLAILKEMRVNF